jgi:alpha-L-fucosidase
LKNTGSIIGPKDDILKELPAKSGQCIPSKKMKKMKKIRIISLILFITFQIEMAFPQGNVHHQSNSYEWPKDELVLEQLEHWRDQKFGMIIHWGLYAVPGIIESWSICSEDWITRDSTISYNNYKEWYFGLNKEFNPTEFDPEQWAKAAKDGGMRYLVFTTKHHDGFCMWDTKQTDFKISAGPFADNPKSDVAKYVFEAFRNEGLMIGAYFSKPDWHSEYYWWPLYATPDRNNNYDIRKNPWRWEKFKEYSYNQVEELMTNYGDIDILWLDGGWVRPLETVTDEVRSWGARIPEWSQDIDLPKIASMARKNQPGLLIVDRTVDGPFENYQTPERRIPDEALDHPWESCMPLGNDWGYVPTDVFKSSTAVIHNLIEVVAKGGSLLLGVGPDASGKLTDKQISKILEIGAWLEKNGEAIYATRTVEHYQDNDVFFTKAKDNSKYYALVKLRENEELTRQVTWKGNYPKPGTKIILLETGKPVKWKKTGDKVIVTIPSAIVKSKVKSAWAFSFTPNN